MLFSLRRIWNNQLILYRIFTPVLFLGMALRTLWAILNRRETFADFCQRIWGPNIEIPSLWIHAASVGEINAARPLISYFAKTQPVVVTTTTTTGRDTVVKWGIANVTSGLAPFDSVILTRRFLSKTRVSAFVIIENELWPNRILTCQCSDIPVVMVNARMSDGTLQTWRKFKSTARKVFAGMKLIVPQNADSAARFATLGAPADIIHPPANLKELYLPTNEPLPTDIAALRDHDVLLAAATHDGEEAMVLDAFKILRKTRPSARLIIAPRHPERGAAIAALIQKSNLSHSRRSAGGDMNSDVYIADTLHEMHHWYRCCHGAFIGGSLVPKGGHTPFEPLAYGCPILHGPNVDNFKDAYRDLGKVAILVQDPTHLAQAFDHILANKIRISATQLPTRPDTQILFTQINAAITKNLV